MWITHAFDWNQHKEGGLCELLHFKPIPGERERTITLEPPAALFGRLLSATGEPLRDVSLECGYETSYASGGRFPALRTDVQGRFRYELPAGGPFKVLSRSRVSFSLAQKLTAEPGEQIDFGELVVSTKGFSGTVTAKSPPKRTPPPAADAGQKASTSSK
jgi:hypothetical protein